jgi:hypothetical protein
MSCAEAVDVNCAPDHNGYHICRPGHYHIDEGIGGCNSVHLVNDYGLQYKWTGDQRTITCAKPWKRIGVSHNFIGIETGQTWSCPK